MGLSVRDIDDWLVADRGDYRAGDEEFDVGFLVQACGGRSLGPTWRQAYGMGT